jgi:HSP20 family protein
MREKKSFFERLTGAKRLPEQSSQGSPYGYSGPTSYGTQNIPTQMSSAEDYAVEPTMQNENIQTEQQEESWAGESEGQLTIDVYQTDNDIVIKSTIAGVKPEDLDVSINNDMVTIRGERKNEEKVEGENYYYQECYWGTFSRSVILPVEVIADKAEAAMKNGILTLRLPKADTTKTKRIQVRGF